MRPLGLSLLSALMVATVVHMVAGTTVVYSNTSELPGHASHYNIVEGGSYTAAGATAVITISSSNVHLVLQQAKATVLVVSANNVSLTILRSTVDTIDCANSNTIKVRVASGSTISSIAHRGGSGSIEVLVEDSFITTTAPGSVNTAVVFLSAATVSGSTKLTLSNVSTISPAHEVLCFHGGAGQVEVVVNKSSTVDCGVLVWVDGAAERAAVAVTNALVALEGTRLVHAPNAKRVALTLTTAKVDGGSSLMFTGAPDSIVVEITSSNIRQSGSAMALIQTEVLRHAQVLLHDNILKGSWSTLALFGSMTQKNVQNDYSDLTLSTTITSNTINVSGSVFQMLSWPPMHLTMQLNGVTATLSFPTVVFTLVHVAKVFANIASGTTDYVAANDITAVPTRAASDIVPNPTSSGKGVTCAAGGVNVCYNSVVVISDGIVNIVLGSGLALGSGAQLTRNAIVASAVPNLSVLFFTACKFTASVKVTFNTVNVAGPSSLSFALLNAVAGDDVISRNNVLYSKNTTYTSSCVGVTSSTKAVVCANTVRLGDNVNLASYSLLNGGSFAAVTLKHTIDLTATVGLVLSNVDVLRGLGVYSIDIESGTSVTSSSTITARLVQTCNASGPVSASSVAVDMSSTTAQFFSFAIMDTLLGTSGLDIASSNIAMTTSGTTIAALCLACTSLGTVSIKSNTITLQQAAVAEAVLVGVVWSGTLSGSTPSLTGTVRGNQLSAAPLNQNPSLTSASCPSGASVCSNTVKIRGAGKATLIVCDGCGAEYKNRLAVVRSNYIGARNFQGDLTVNLCRGCVALHMGRTHVMNHALSIINGSRFSLNYGGLSVTHGSAVVRWNEITGAPANVSHLGATWLSGCSAIDDGFSKICGNTAVVDFGYVVTTMSRYHTGVVQAVGATFCSDCHVLNGTLLVADNFFETMNTTGADVVYCDRCSATGISQTPDSGTLTVHNNTALTHMAKATEWELKVNGYDRTFTSDVQVYSESVVVCRSCEAHHPYGQVVIANNTFEHARNPDRSDNVTNVRGRTFQNYISATLCSKCASDGNTSELRAVNNTLTAVGQFYATVRFCTSCAMNDGAILVAANLVNLEYLSYSNRLDVQVASIVSTGGTVNVINNSLPISYNATSDFYSVNATPHGCDDVWLQRGAANNRTYSRSTAQTFICGNVLRTLASSSLSVSASFCTDCIASDDGRQIQVLHNALNCRTPGASIDLVMCDGCAGNVFFAYNVLHSVATSISVSAAFCKLCVISSDRTLFRQLNNSMTGTVNTARIAMAGFKAAHMGRFMMCDNALIAYQSLTVSDPAPIWPEVFTDSMTVSDKNDTANDSASRTWCNVPPGWSVSGNNSVLLRNVASLDATTCTGCHTAGNGTLHLINHTFYTSARSTTLTVCRDCSVGASSGYGDLYIANNGFIVNRSTNLNVRINEVMISESRHVVRHNEVFERPSYDEQPLHTRDQRYALCHAQYQAFNGSLMCGNIVQSIRSNAIAVILVDDLRALGGDPVVVSDNVITTVLATSLALSWCYECRVQGAMLFVVRNYGHTNGTTDVTVLQGGVHVYNGYQLTLTNNHFVATKSATLPPNDALFVAAAFERVPASWVLAGESTSFNNSVVSVLVSTVETSMCRNCLVEDGASVRVLHNEARVSNATKAIVSLCTDCRLRAKGFLNIVDNVVDALNVSTVTTFVFRDVQTWWTPLRVYGNLWLGFNTTRVAENAAEAQLYSKGNLARCASMETIPFLERRACGNSFHLRDATNIAVTLCRGLYARSLVVLEDNAIHLTDAKGTATAEGCLHCRAEPRSAGLNTIVVVPPQNAVPGTTPGGSPGDNVTRAPTPSSNASVQLRRNGTTTDTKSLTRTESVPHALSQSKSVSMTYTATLTASQSLPATKLDFESGVAVFNNVFNVQRYSAAVFTLLGGGSWQGAPCGAWNNAMNALNTTSVYFTLLHYFTALGATVAVRNNVASSNANVYNAAESSNLTQNVLECPVGACRNRCLSRHASDTFVTLGDGMAGDAGVVSNNHVDAVTARTATIIMNYNSSTSQLNVAHNAVSFETSLATLYVAKQTLATTLHATLNPLNATGPAAERPLMPSIGNAVCPSLVGAGAVVCNNTIAAQAASFDMHVVSTATTSTDVTADEHNVDGFQVHNFSYTLLESIASTYGDLILRNNAVRMIDLGDAAANVSTCSQRCTGSYINATTPSTGASASNTQAFSTNQTARVTMCAGCSFSSSISVVNNAVNIQGAQHVHCNHCLLATSTDFSVYGLAAYHAKFTAKAERTLRTGMIDIIVCDRCTTSVQSGGSIVATGNTINVQEADVQTCPTASDVPVCPSFAMGRSLTDANTARCLILSRVSVNGVLTVQSNTIAVNNLNEESYVSLVLVTQLSLDAQIASTIKLNTVTAAKGIIHAFICATCTSNNPTNSPTKSTLSLQQNTVDLTGNDTSFAVCIGCNAYRQLIASSNTVSGSHGKRGSGAVCIDCYCDDEATFSATSNIMTFTNVTTFQAVIGFGVRVYGVSLSVVKNGIAGSSGTPISFTLGACPTAAFLLCKNEIRGFQVQRVNTSVCRDCRLSNSTPTATQQLTVSGNIVNVQDVIAAAITLVEGSVSGSKTVCSVVSNTVAFKNMLSARLVPFLLSSTYSDTDAKQNVLDFNNVSTMDGYLVGGSKNSPGRSSDVICVQNNLLTTSSTATAAVVGSPAGCHIAVISNTVRVHGGSDLSGWSLLGAAGSKGTYRLGSNTIAAGLDIQSVISSIDPDTQLPSYASGATFELNGNNFPGKNLTIGVTSGDNRVTVTGGSFSFLSMYGVASNNNYATSVVLSGVTLEGILLSGGLGSFTMSVTSTTFTADNMIAAEGATTSGLSILIFASGHSAPARRGFAALGQATPVSDAAVNVVYAENSTLQNSNITFIGGTFNLVTGALVALKNSTVIGGRLHWTSVALTDARLLNMHNSTLRNGVIAVVDSSFASSTEVVVASSDCSATSNFMVNVTGTTFAPKASIPAPNVAEMEGNMDLRGLRVYYDTSAFTSYKALHNTDARYSLFLACTTWEGVSGFDLNRTAYFPYSRDSTLKVLSWAGAICFSRTPTPSLSKSPQLSISVPLPITLSQRLSLTRSLHPTETLSTSLSPTISTSSSMTASGTPSPTMTPTTTGSASPSQSSSPSLTRSSSPTETATLYGDPAEDPFLLILLCSTFGGLLLIGLGVFALWRYHRSLSTTAAAANTSDDDSSDDEGKNKRRGRTSNKKKKTKKTKKKHPKQGQNGVTSVASAQPSAPVRNPLEFETEMV